MDKKQVILDFVKQHMLAVVSTVGADNKPESAVVGFGETNDLELIFSTFTTSRKYKNVKVNKNVSFVIGWENNMTVQYEGVAEEVLGDDAKKYQELYWSKNPSAQRWENVNGIAYFKVLPNWIRMTDLNKSPWEITQVNF